MNLQVAHLYTICRWAHFNVKLHFLGSGKTMSNFGQFQVFLGVIIFSSPGPPVGLRAESPPWGWSILIRSMLINVDPINADPINADQCRSVQIRSMLINTDPTNADQYRSDQCWSMLINPDLINADQHEHIAANGKTSLLTYTVYSIFCALLNGRHCLLNS